MYDVVIIGAGPAGLTAAIYAARREMKALVAAKELGGQLIWASEIENYPGFKNIQAMELIARMREQVEALGVEIKTAAVNRIEEASGQAEKNFLISLGQERIEARTVIIAAGLVPKQLMVPGEKELSGRGVSYCANCDGPFFRQRTVAVIGGGNSALDAAEVLSKIAAKVHLIHRHHDFRGFESLVDEVKNRENIEIHLGKQVLEIKGTAAVEAITAKDGQTGDIMEIPVNGVFVEIGRRADTDMLAGLIERDERNQIKVDEAMRTSRPGIFAAGDVTDKALFKQITIATGQATIAALSAYQYLQLNQGGHGHVSIDRKIGV